jgi:hypothetical protein
MRRKLMKDREVFYKLIGDYLDHICNHISYGPDFFQLIRTYHQSPGLLISYNTPENLQILLKILPDFPGKGVILISGLIQFGSRLPVVGALLYDEVVGPVVREVWPEIPDFVYKFPESITILYHLHENKKVFTRLLRRVSGESWSQRRMVEFREAVLYVGNFPEHEIDFGNFWKFDVDFRYS